MNKFFSLLCFALTCVACGPGNDDGGSSDTVPSCPDGYEECGTQCMPLGNSCCPNDSLSCPDGSLCNMDSLCVATDNVQTDCLAGRERCGIGCMPVGSDCCDRSEGAYCDVGTTCYVTDQCQSGGNVPTTTAPVANVPLTTGLVTTTTGPGACGKCDGGWYTCSQWVAGDKCSWQSCTCYYQNSGSDTWRAWYQTGSADHVTGCYQCETDEQICQEAAQSLVNACYNVGG